MIAAPGDNYGLDITLDTQLDQYYQPLTESVGFKMLVHEKNEFPLIDGMGFSTMPGVATFVAIKKNMVSPAAR